MGPECDDRLSDPSASLFNPQIFICPSDTHTPHVRIACTPHTQITHSTHIQSLTQHAHTQSTPHTHTTVLHSCYPLTHHTLLHTLATNHTPSHIHTIYIYTHHTLTLILSSRRPHTALSHTHTHPTHCHTPHTHTTDTVTHSRSYSPHTPHTPHRLTHIPHIPQTTHTHIIHHRHCPRIPHIHTHTIHTHTHHTHSCTHTHTPYTPRTASFCVPHQCSASEYQEVLVSQERLFSSPSKDLTPRNVLGDLPGGTEGGTSNCHPRPPGSRVSGTFTKQMRRLKATPHPTTSPGTTERQRVTRYPGGAETPAHACHQLLPSSHHPRSGAGIYSRGRSGSHSPWSQHPGAPPPRATRRFPGGRSPPGGDSGEKGSRGLLPPDAAKPPHLLLFPRRRTPLLFR